MPTPSAQSALTRNPSGYRKIRAKFTCSSARMSANNSAIVHDGPEVRSHGDTRPHFLRADRFLFIIDFIFLCSPHCLSPPPKSSCRADSTECLQCSAHSDGSLKLSPHTSTQSATSEMKSFILFQSSLRLLHFYFNSIETKKWGHFLN